MTPGASAPHLARARIALAPFLRAPTLDSFQALRAGGLPSRRNYAPISCIRMSRRRWMLAFLACVPIVGVACSLFVDLDSLGAVGCGPGSVCRSAIPTGWEGPVTLVVGGADAGCDTPFAIGTLGSLQSDLDAGTATCSCKCEPRTGACTWPGSGFSGAGCTGTAYENTFTSSCGPIQGSGTGWFRILDAGSRSDAGCSAVSAITRPSVGVTESHLCLGSFVPGSCAASNLCVPRAPAHCIARAGDQSCPSPYDAKRLLHRSFEDRRGCSACGCEAKCDPSPDIVISSAPCGADGGGGDAETRIPTTGTCVTVPLTSGYTLSLTPSSTVVTQPTLDGSVVGTDPVTVCCEP